MSTIGVAEFQRHRISGFIEGFQQGCQQYFGADPNVQSLIGKCEVRLASWFEVRVLAFSAGYGSVSEIASRRECANQNARPESLSGDCFGVATFVADRELATCLNSWRSTAESIWSLFAISFANSSRTIRLGTR